MNERIIISGFGGQGILSTGLIIAEATVFAGYEATYFPSYGVEMRGGTANCHVIISDRPIGSPIITQADTLIAFNEPSVRKFIPMVKNEGLVIINSSAVENSRDYGNRRVVQVPVETIALEKLGKTRFANIIMLGAYVKTKAIVKLEEMKKSIMEKFSSKGESLVQLNFQALELGYAA